MSYDLFAIAESKAYNGDWRPEPPPSLSGIRDIELDAETTGLRWWAGDMPVGYALRVGKGSEARKWYLPIRHSGGNLDEAVVKRWFQREVRNKRITNLNTRFDVHITNNWGVDLEDQGNEVSDVAHYAALLDDHRQRFNLNDIAHDYLGEGKIGQELDKRRMASYHAGEVADYAMGDVDLVGRLKEVMWPMLDEQDLQPVRGLEDKVIYPVCAMERVGLRIDVDLLDRWVRASEQEYLRLLYRINDESGVKFTGTNETWRQLFAKAGISITEKTAKGAPSFTDSILRMYDHPWIQMGRRAVRIASLRSKYLVKFQKTVDRSTGILRYALHQLRAIKNEWDESDGAGTVSGRFSSTALTVPGEEDTGHNAQQTMKVAKQRILFGYDEDDDTHDDEIYIIRRLYVSDRLWLSSDAKQIEYRLFAHYANSPRILDAYKKDPDMSFHKFMWELLRPYVSLVYRQQKDLNFAKVYGAGLAKMALMMGFITAHQYEALKEKYTVMGKFKGIPRDEPLLEKARAIDDIYNREIPEVKPLLDKAKKLAENRGYVKTMLGRRSRFPNGHRSHKAFNCVDQGTGADIMKQKVVALHETRKETNFLMRITVHDEVDGDIPDVRSAHKVSKILDQQTFDLRVPILWDTGIGTNWANESSLANYTKEGEFDSIETVRTKLGYHSDSGGHGQW